MSVPTRLVEQWESGEVAPSLEMVKELAAVMGTSIRVSLAPRATSESDGTPPCDPCIMTGGRDCDAPPPQPQDGL